MKNWTKGVEKMINVLANTLGKLLQSEISLLNTQLEGKLVTLYLVHLGIKQRLDVN